MNKTIAVVLAGFSAFLTLFATQPLLPQLASVFGASQFAVSLTVTASTLGVACAAPIIGTVADRLGRKRVIVWSAFLLALSTAFAATATSLQALLVWRFLEGIFTPGVFAVTVAYIQEEWAGGGTGTATAYYVTGTVVGGLVSRLASGLVAERWNWQLAFVVLGAIGLACAIVLALFLPKERRFLRPQASPFRAALRHLKNPALLATFVIGFCLLFSLLGSFTYITFYLAAEPFHLNAAALGSLFFVYLVSAVITPNSGRIIDRYGARKTLVWATLLAGIGLLLTLSSNLAVVIVGMALICSGIFVCGACTNTYVGTAAKDNKALAVGLYVTFYYVGGSAGSSLPGSLWAIGGWPACVALFVGVQLLTAGIAVVYWKRPHEHCDNVALHVTPD